MNKKTIQNILLAIAYSIWVVGVFWFVSIVLVGLPIQLLASDALYEWLKTPFGMLTLGVITYALSLAIVLAPMLIRKVPLIKIREKLGLLEKIRPAMIPWSVFAWGLYFIATMIVMGILYTMQIPGVDLEQKQNIGITAISGASGYVLAFVLLVVVAPIFEELLFRGYLFGELRIRVGFWLSAIMVSIAFGVLHGQLNVGIDTFVLSMFLCYLRERFDSVWPGVIVHSIKNSLAFVLLFILPLYGISLV